MVVGDSTTKWWLSVAVGTRAEVSVCPAGEASDFPVEGWGAGAVAREASEARAEEAFLQWTL